MEKPNTDRLAAVEKISRIAMFFDGLGENNIANELMEALDVLKRWEEFGVTKTL